MNKYFLIFIIILSCNSKNENSKLNLENNKAQTNSKSNNNIKPSIIYDTLVFQENMNGKMLINKFNESKDWLKFYKKYINIKSVNKKVQLDHGDDCKTEIIYLGELRDLNDKNSYHIITDFRTIGKTKGRSAVAFIDETKTKIITYNLPMPEGLPKYIDQNVLFFQSNGIKIGVSLKGGLPPLLCLPEIGCN